MAATRVRQQLPVPRLAPAARHRYATDNFLRWLYATAQDRRPTDPAAFLGTTAADFAGSALSETELDYALARLTNSALVADAGTQPKTVAITLDGIDCVLSGATVSDYLNRTRPGDYYNIAFDPSALREFAALVQQLAPTYGLQPEQQAELVHDAELLGEEADGESAEPGRIRTAYEAVMGRLTQIGTASAALTTTLQQGQQAYSTVFGG